MTLDTAANVFASPEDLAADQLADRLEWQDQACREGWAQIGTLLASSADRDYYTLTRYN